MNVHTLKVFCDVIDTCSFSETANLNFVTQSAVSQQINALEKKYGDPLFIRGKGRFDLTPSGQILYDRAKEILNIYDSIENDILMTQNVIAGMVKISTIYSIGLHELPNLVTQFMKNYPEVNLHIEYARMNKVAQDVASGSVDIGIVAYPKNETNVDVIPFRTDNLVCIMSPNHALAKLKKIKLSDLENVDFISFDKDIPTGKSIIKRFKEADVQLKIKTSFDNIETIKRAVEVEQGVSIVPFVTVQKEVNLKTLVAKDFEGFKWERPIGILVRAGKKRQAITDLFVDFLTKNK